MTHLNEGDKAPDFTLLNQNGEEVRLSNYLGKKVVLFFYPRDNTPGCTSEACSINENHSQLQNKNVVVFGISPDSAQKHQKFKDKYGFTFDLLVDEDKEVLNLYGVWGEKKFMGKTIIGVHRTTFVIDENGVIDHIFRKVKTKTHGEDLVALIKG
jgi:peroxiredoxin Q/BCP